MTSQPLVIHIAINPPKALVQVWHGTALIQPARMHARDLHATQLGEFSRGILFHGGVMCWSGGRRRSGPGKGLLGVCYKGPPPPQPHKKPLRDPCTRPPSPTPLLHLNMLLTGNLLESSLPPPTSIFPTSYCNIQHSTHHMPEHIGNTQKKVSSVTGS